jgi:hypothetical protein
MLTLESMPLENPTNTNTVGGIYGSETYVQPAPSRVILGLTKPQSPSISEEIQPIASQVVSGNIVTIAPPKEPSVIGGAQPTTTIPEIINVIPPKPTGNNLTTGSATTPVKSESSLVDTVKTTVSPTQAQGNVANQKNKKKATTNYLLIGGAVVGVYLVYKLLKK